MDEMGLGRETYFKTSENVLLLTIVFGHELDADIEDLAAREPRCVALWRCEGKGGEGEFVWEACELLVISLT